MFDLTYFQSRVEQAVGLLHREPKLSVFTNC